MGVLQRTLTSERPLYLKPGYLDWITHMLIFGEKKIPDDSLWCLFEKFFKPIYAFRIDFFVKSTCTIFACDDEKLLCWVLKHLVYNRPSIE